MPDDPPREGDRPPWTALLEVPSLGRGGMESVVAMLARGLPAHGIEAVVVCTESGGPGVPELRDRGIRVEVLGDWDKVARMAELLDRLQVGVLNAHYSNLGTPLAHARAIPVVTTLHNAYAWYGPGAFDEMGRLDPMVDRYIAVSRSVAEFTRRRFHIDGSRIDVVRNGIAPGTVAPPGETARSVGIRTELGLADDAEILLQVGRIEPPKGQAALVEAVARLRDDRPGLVVLFAGDDGDVAYAQDVRSRIEATGLGDRVHLLGRREDVPGLLAEASVAVMPSIFEGLSLAAVEALGAGVPSVLTRTGDAAWLLGEGGAGPLPGALVDAPIADLASLDWGRAREAARVVDANHAAALAEALSAVLADLPARRDAARARAAILEEELSADRMCDQTAAILEAAVARAFVPNRLELARTRVECERLGDLQAVLEEVRGIDRRQLEKQARLVDRLEAVATTATAILDRLRVRKRLGRAVSSFATRVTGRLQRARANEDTSRMASEGGRSELDRRRLDRWLIVAPGRASRDPAEQRARHFARSLVEAGEVVTLGATEGGPGMPAVRGPSEGLLEVLPAGLENFERWMVGRDERLHLVYFDLDRMDLEVAQRARQLGAHVLCDVAEPWTQPARARAGLDLCDHVVCATAGLAARLDFPPRALHVLPDVPSPAIPLRSLAARPTVSIIVLCHNNRDIIESCVESLVEQRGRLDYEILIVDNASEDGSWEWLRERAGRGDIEVRQNERNGCSSGRNLGVAQTTGEIIVFLDSDQRALHPGWLDPALAILGSDRQIGAVSWNAGWFRAGTGGGPIVDDLPGRGMSGPHAEACFRTDIAFLATSGFACPRAVFARTEGFDEFLDPTCFEDTDLSFQIKELGYELAYCPHLAIDHRPHATTGALGDYSELYKRNEKYFLEKWSHRPGYFFDLP